MDLDGSGEFQCRPEKRYLRPIGGGWGWKCSRWPSDGGVVGRQCGEHLALRWTRPRFGGDVRRRVIRWAAQRNDSEGRAAERLVAGQHRHRTVDLDVRRRRHGAGQSGRSLRNTTDSRGRTIPRLALERRRLGRQQREYMVLRRMGLRLFAGAEHRVPERRLGVYTESEPVDLVEGLEQRQPERQLCQRAVGCWALLRAVYTKPARRAAWLRIVAARRRWLRLGARRAGLRQDLGQWEWLRQ